MNRSEDRNIWRVVLAAVLLCGMVGMNSVAVAATPWLHVEGNQVQDPDGNLVCLRGVALCPKEHIWECHHCNTKPYSEMVAWQADAAKGWYSRVLRLPVTLSNEPDIPTSFAENIDPWVQQAINQDQYVIVDYHKIADYDADGDGAGGVTQQQLVDFWTYVAPYYADVPNVIFEVYNEPISPDDWDTWKSFIQPVVDEIRAVAPDNLIYVGSPSWSTRANGALTNPVTGGNIVYVYHLYPNQGDASAANLDPRFGNAADTIPIVVSEFGWNKSGQYSDSVTNGTTSGWGSPLRDYLDARPWISWQSWIFDNFWKPQYFDNNWNLLGGEDQGQFMKQWLYELRNDHQPGGGDTTPPAAPTGLTATAVSPSGIDLDWDDNTENDLDSYNVYREGALIAADVASSQYGDTGLSPSTQYCYTVTAEDTSHNESAESNQACATTQQGDTTPPAAPTGLTAAAVSSSQVDLDWDDNTEGDLDSYNVYRDTVQIATDVTTSQYSDTGLSPSTQYCYTVTAVDTSANESTESNQACATTAAGGTTMHVDGIAHGVKRGRVWGWWARITVVDDVGAVVEGATVTGTFDGWDDDTQSNVTETKSGVTDKFGEVQLESVVDSGTFCVDNVTHATLTYDSSQNVVTCVSF